MVTQSPKTNLEFIDKWITISINASIEPFIIFNKIDLLTNDEFKEIQKIYEDLGIKTFQISAKLRTNIDVLKEYLLKKTAIFVGNSGSGKSTLTSAITGKKYYLKPFLTTKVFIQLHYQRFIILMKCRSLILLE